MAVSGGCGVYILNQILLLVCTAKQGIWTHTRQKPVHCRNNRCGRSYVNDVSSLWVFWLPRSFGTASILRKSAASLQRRSSPSLLISDTSTSADSGAGANNSNHREPHKQQFTDFTFVAAVERKERSLSRCLCSCNNKFTGAKEDMEQFRLKLMAGTYFMAS